MREVGIYRSETTTSRVDIRSSVQRYVRSGRSSKPFSSPVTLNNFILDHPKLHPNAEINTLTHNNNTQLQNPTCQPHTPASQAKQTSNLLQKPSPADQDVSRCTSSQPDVIVTSLGPVQPAPYGAKYEAKPKPIVAQHRRLQMLRMHLRQSILQSSSHRASSVKPRASGLMQLIRHTWKRGSSPAPDGTRVVRNC